MRTKERTRQTEICLNPLNKKGFIHNVVKYKFLYLLMLPGLLYFLIFCYLPMYGVVIAFQDFKPYLGLQNMLIHPNWVGLQHFRDFFESYYFFRLLRNTVLISLYKLALGFPAAIILALMLNEVKHLRFKKIVQTISYLPYFLSWIIITGMISTMLSPDSGAVNEILKAVGIGPFNFLGDNRFFRGVIVASSIWAGAGWQSIIYLAALSGVNPELYECAEIEGANRLQKVWYISLPTISNIIAIMLIFSLGDILNAGFDQIVLLYSPLVWETGDIIDTYIYREGLLNIRYSYAAAIGMFKSVIGMVFILGANYFAKRMGKEGIW